jgi:hypothetical protein
LPRRRFGSAFCWLEDSPRVYTQEERKQKMTKYQLRETTYILEGKSRTISIKKLLKR